MKAAFPGSTTAQLDREFLALVDRGEATEETVALYRAALDDPEQRSRTAELYRRGRACFWRPGCAAGYRCGCRRPRVSASADGRGAQSAGWRGLDLHIAWEDIAEIRRDRRDHAGIRAARVDDGVLSVGVGNTTNVAVRLMRPITARLPRGHVEATAVHFSADGAAAVVAAAHEQLARTSGRRWSARASMTSCRSEVWRLSVRSAR